MESLVCLRIENLLPSRRKPKYSLGSHAMPIRILNENISGLIAAGEVVERPASIIKELLENSIDAHATSITITIKNGGIDYIRVTDNGLGIPHDQVPLAFQRFATSKISTSSDLDAISTLGFRGEALPSIAAVSHMEMTTRETDTNYATQIILEGGIAAELKKAGAPNGTTIIVQKLFHNVPVRRKFLRSSATEASHIQTLVTRYSLAYPEIQFQLENGKKNFSTNGDGDIIGTIAKIYNVDIANQLLSISERSEGALGEVTISGVACPPHISRSNKQHITLFVNRRWVRDQSLSFAVEQAYQGFLMNRRHPIAIVNLQIPPDQIDVNTHPSKTEIRIRNKNHVFAALQRSIRQALTAKSPIPPMSQSKEAYSQRTERLIDYKNPFWTVEPYKSDRDRPDAGKNYVGANNRFVEFKEKLPLLRVLGQIQSTYIVTEGPDGLYLIDQHAAHERVIFEEIRSADSSNSSGKQALMEPIIIEMSESQEEILSEHASLLESVGLLLEPFGGNSYIIRSIPKIMLEADPETTIFEILDEISLGGNIKNWRDRTYYTIACHSAIRAGKSLTHKEMELLVRSLEQCDHPHNCPHGRPTMIQLSISKLEREFGRR